MSASLEIKGLAELRKSMHDLPESLKRRQLGPVVRTSADGLAGELKATYPKKTGELANGIVVEHDETENGLRARVKSTARHSHLYDLGSVRRFTKGTGAYRGTMPARPTFVPAAVRWRQRMLSNVKAILGRLGVPGFTGTLSVRES